MKCLSIGDYKEAVGMTSPRKKSPARSKARGRSPGRRPRSKSPARRKQSPGRKPVTPKSPKVEKTIEKVEITEIFTSPRRRAAAVKAEINMKESPQMTLRLKKWEPTPPTSKKMEDVVDSDGEVSQSKAGKPSKMRTTEFCGAFGIVLMIVSFIGILMTCQLLLRAEHLAVKKFDIIALFKNFPMPTLLAAEIYFGFVLIQMLLCLLPYGRLEQSVPGTPGPSSYRCNGIINAIVTLSTICVLHIYFNIGLTYKQLNEMIPQWTAIAIISAILLAAMCYFRASRLSLAQLNPSLVDTGRIYNFCMGKEINPCFFNYVNIKAICFKIAINALLSLHLALYFALDATQRTPTLMLAMGMINFYIADALLFERHFYTTFEYTNEGWGLMLCVGYALYPFFPLLITGYLATSRYEVSMPFCAVVLVIFLMGYIVYRASNTEKSEFRRNPLNPTFANSETIPTSRGKRLLCSGWWGFLRHPNYFGDILMHVAWALTAGIHPIPLVLPVTTILLLLHRSHRDSARCQAKYGDAWTRYCEKVPRKCIPKVF